jgi:hypothetical protein
MMVYTFISLSPRKLFSLLISGVENPLSAFMKPMSTVALTSWRRRRSGREAGNHACRHSRPRLGLPSAWPL